MPHDASARITQETYEDVQGLPAKVSLQVKTMGPLFSSLIENSLSEIERREPRFLARFPFVMPSGNSRRDRCHQHPGLRSLQDNTIDRAVDDAISYLDRRGVPLTNSDQAADPASLVIFDALLDAVAADQNVLPIRPGPSAEHAAGDLLANQFDERRTGSGRRYVISRRGTQPLVVVNALGIPFSIWSKLASDPSHSFRIVTVENRCGDLVSGGMHSDVALTQHVDDIIEVLDHEKLDSFHVLGWCNGGRIAIDLVVRNQFHVRSLTLLSPTLRGTQGASQPGSPFEDRLEQIFTTVKRNQALATPLVKMISGFSQPPDWDGLAADPEGRAKALFAMPARESAAAFLIPMSAPPFLVNYARRTAADEAYPMADALHKLAATSIPVLLITGSHDSMVSNQSTCAALRNGGVPMVHAEVSGAGHYIQDLQYPYFLWLLQNFTSGEKIPGNTLRVKVQCPEKTSSTQ